MTPPLLHDQTLDGRIQKPRGTERWALGVGVLILLGLFGHLLHQQQSSNSARTAGAKSTQAPARVSAPTPVPEIEPPAGPIAKPGRRSGVTYTVTHKHRLSDCHGTLTFTKDELRFQSDEPQDSFTVAVGEVTLEGDAVRIRNKTWHFKFDDDVSAQRIFQSWKQGFARPISRP